MSEERAASPMTCSELVELVTDYIEGSLPTTDRERFEAHVDRCVGCARFVEQFRSTIEAAGCLDEDAIAPEVRDHLLGAFRDWKRGE